MPIAWDLCAGMGGGSAGLKAAGFKVIAFDIEAWPNPHADVFVQGDIRDFSGKDLMEKYGRPSFIWASPPCQQFSYRSFPFKRCRVLRDTVPPDKSIWEACQRLADECECPIVIENVRGAEGVNYLHAEWFMGKAKAHYGSFYLWGDVPALLPIGRAIKGFQGVDTKSRGGKGPLNQLKLKVSPRDGKQWRGNSPHFGWNDEKVQSKRKVEFKDMAHSSHSSHSSHSDARKQWSAKAAMIPIELSTWIGQCFYTQEPHP